MREDLIERLRVIAQWLDHRAHFESEPETKASHAEDADTCREAAAALEAAREDAANSLGALRVAVIALASAAKGSAAYLPAYNHISAAIDQARGKGVADEA